MSGCRSYCGHGGICILDKGHEGLHDSRYCQWDDDHALTETEADFMLSKTPLGRKYLDLKDIFRETADDLGVPL